MAKRLRALLLITSLIALTSCSRLELGYRNLDLLIPWSMDNYVSLTGEQKAWLKPRLTQHIAWHCQTQLPRYADWLQRSAKLAGEAKPEAAQFQAQFSEFRHAVDAIVVQVTPDLTELLQGMSPAQVQELEKNLAKQNKEQREDYLELPLDEQIADRAERMEERVKPWFGRLHPEQKARIKTWAQQLGDYNRGWLDNNQRWQQAFLAAINERKGEQFSTQMKRLLQERMSYWTPDYQQQFDAAQLALSGLFADLVSSADAKQRERLQERLEGMRKQLADMTCP
ncbi:MAG: DUF6279 family lipoprotein [Pseudomonas sp.]|uniref:DUF6279 family lipoprotein n=1 Tax=Pseudomonas sp. TaxID=306 RepID=UPI0030F245A3